MATTKMNCFIPVLIVISVFVGWTDANIGQAGLGFNSVQRQEVKRAAPMPALDFATLKDNPMVKAGLAKAAEVLKTPQVQAILKSEAFQNAIKPENMKKILDSDAIPRMATAENIKKLLSTPQGQALLANEQVKAFITSDTFKAYIVKFKEILPQLIAIAKAKVDAMVAAQG